jgi:hypothetical protein
MYPKWDGGTEIWVANVAKHDRAKDKESDERETFQPHDRRVCILNNKHNMVTNIAYPPS